MHLLDVSRPLEIDRLYVDVNILSEPTSYICVEIDDLLQDRDYRTDFNRFGLPQMRERVAGIQAVKDHPKLMVLGKPGSGKTTFLQHVVIECNNGNLLSERVPILIKLKEFVEDTRETRDFSLGPYIGSCLRGCSQSEIETLLQAGKVLLLLDGLDEVPGTDGNEVVKQIERFVQNYDRNPLIITCRIQAQKYRFRHLTYVEVADFNSEQIAAFARKWFVATARNGVQEGLAKVQQFIKRLNLPENKQIRDLAVTPILLSLTCKVFSDKGKFYSKRHQLYEQGLEILLSKWDESRGIKRDQVYRNLTVEQKQKLLSYVATRKFEQRQYVLFEQSEIQEYIAEYLGISAEDSQAGLESIEAQHGLLIERAQGIYSFSYLTFQEYFTAKSFVNCGHWQGLVNHVTDKHWREVFMLAVRMVKNADELLWLMKQYIDRLIALDEKLQQFLKWVNQKSVSSQIPSKTVDICSFYFNLGLANELDIINIDLLFSFDIYARVLDLKFYIVLLEKHIKSTLRSGKNYIVFEWNVPEPSSEYLRSLKLELLQALQQIGSQLPKTSDDEKDTLTNQQWWKIYEQMRQEKLRAVIIKYRNIGHDWHFSDEQKELLHQYYDANRLLVDCMNSGCVVSDEVRKEIEETLLLPIAEIEGRKSEG